MIEGIVVLGVVVGVAFFFFLLAVLVVRNLLYICGPNEVLIFSGATRDVEGRPVGYRIVKGGRSVRIPLLETVDRVDLTNMIIEVSVTNAYSKGGIPMTVQGVANVKIAGHEPVLNNAIERFLGYDRKEIVQVAKDTLEGNLRGVLSQLTPEQVNEDKIAFAEKLLEEAEHDLTRLGLTLDTLKIQNVADDKGYLNSIGRKSSADLIKRSKVAETIAKAKSITQDATNRERSRIQTIESEIEILRTQTERRIVDTLSRREALVAEEVGRVKAAVARAEGELKVQAARVEQVRRQLEADVIAPAQAEMEKSQADAKGGAAKIVEDGKATAEVLDQMIATWQAGGDAARDIFLMQKLQATMSQMMSTIQHVKVDRLTVLPPDAEVSARKAVTLVEELKGALGVDIPAVVQRAVEARSS
ncbi:MAG: flotillin family protein [Myxococcota bacterium]